MYNKRTMDTINHVINTLMDYINNVALRRSLLVPPLPLTSIYTPENIFKNRKTFKGCNQTK